MQKVQINTCDSQFQPSISLTLLILDFCDWCDIHTGFSDDVLLNPL